MQRLSSGRIHYCYIILRNVEKEKKERHTHLNAEFQRIARRDKKASLIDQCKEIEENNKMGKTRDLFGEGNGIPLQYSYLENAMDGGAW